MNKKLTSIIFAASLLTITLLTMANAKAANNAEDYSAIKKDIKVISKVLSSSTELEGSRAHLRVSGRYLAKQGIVFNITFPHSSSGFSGSFNFSMPDIPDTPYLADVPSADEIEAIVEESLSQVGVISDYFDDEEDEEHEFVYNNAPESDAESSARDKERRAFRAEQKALRKHQKAMEKKARALEKQARKLSEEKRIEFMQKNKKEIKEIRQKVKETAKKYKAKAIEFKKNRLAERQKNANKWTLNLMESFCSYAPYPRNLPNNEYVTLVLNNAFQGSHKRQDKVIVLNKKQLASCRDGKWNGERLLNQALSYNY